MGVITQSLRHMGIHPGRRTNKIRCLSKKPTPTEDDFRHEIRRWKELTIRRAKDALSLHVQTLKWLLFRCYSWEKQKRYLQTKQLTTISLHKEINLKEDPMRSYSRISGRKQIHLEEDRRR